MRAPHCLVDPFPCHRNRSLGPPITFRRPVSRRMEGVGPIFLLSVNGSRLRRSWSLLRRRITACRKASEVSGRRPREAPSTPRTEAEVDPGQVSENAYIKTGRRGRLGDTPHSTPEEIALRPLSKFHGVADPLTPAGLQPPAPRRLLSPVEIQWSFKSIGMTLHTTVWMAASKGAFH